MDTAHWIQYNVYNKINFELQKEYVMLIVNNKFLLILLYTNSANLLSA